MGEFHVQKVGEDGRTDTPAMAFGHQVQCIREGRNSTFFQDVLVGKRRAKGSRVGFFAS